MSAAAPFRELSAGVLRGFTGGLNLRDAPDELAPSESPDLWNVVLDERGGFGSRLGLTKWNVTPFHGSDKVVAAFEWHHGGHVVTQVGAKLYLDFSTTTFKTFTTTARCGFAEFAGKLWIIHPIDGLFQSDGTLGGTAVVATGPKGSTLAVWQNRLWANDATSARLYFSAIGNGAQWSPSQTTTSGGTLALPSATVTVVSTAGFDPTGSLRVGTGGTQDVVTYTGVTATTFTGCLGGTHSWPSGTVVTQGTNFNDVIEKDEEPIVCLKGASGQDVIGQPGLIAFKHHSTYRINDSDTGSYTTLDPEVGCASNAAAVVVLGRVYAISEAGICWTDGRGPMRVESDKLRPLWADDQLAFNKLDLWVAGRRGTHVVFSVPTVAATANDLALEHYPGSTAQNAATTVGDNAASCYLTLIDAEETLLSGSPTVPGQVYANGTGGTDDGTAIHAYFQTYWWTVSPERLARIRSAIFEGHGDFTCYTTFDYSVAKGDPRAVSIGGGGGFVWNSGWHWNDGSTWGPDTFAGYSDPLPSLGVGRVVSFRAEARTTSVSPKAALSGHIAPVQGAWSVYAIHLKTVPLKQL